MPAPQPPGCRLYKQATAGACAAPRPGFFDRKGRAKWQAWKDCAGLTAGEAQQRYVQLLTQLVPDWAGSGGGGGGGEGGGPRRGGAGGPVQSRLAGGAEEESEVRCGARQAGAGCTALLPNPAADACLSAWPSPLRAQGPDATPPLLQAARGGDAAEVQRLLQQPGCAVDQRGADGETALHWAADRGQLPVLRLLLAAGADVNATDADGQAALHYAALAEQREAAELLAAAPGVQPGLRNADGETPADEAPADWAFLRAGAAQ